MSIFVYRDGKIVEVKEGDIKARETTSPNINMRNTPYGKSTKIEFTHRTLEESADKMRKDIHG